MQFNSHEKEAQDILNAYFNETCPLPVDVEFIAQQMGIRLLRDIENTPPFAFLECFLSEQNQWTVRHGSRGARDPAAYRQALADVIHRVSRNDLDCNEFYQYREAPVGAFVQTLLVPRVLLPMPGSDKVAWLCEQYGITPRLACIVIEDNLSVSGFPFSESRSDPLLRAFTGR